MARRASECGGGHPTPVAGHAISILVADLTGAIPRASSPAQHSAASGGAKSGAKASEALERRAEGE
eukprot:scaffold787_cov240-Pinguiococcus_pyrenoidosus.AAC.3